MWPLKEGSSLHERPFMEWPDGSHDATRLGVDWRLHALPKWAARDLHGVAYCFRDAAEAVFEAAGRRPVDILFLPLAYLWRHHLELILKANLQIWCRLTETELPTLVGRGGIGHDLRRLWVEFVAVSSPEISDGDRQDAEAAGKALDTFLMLEPHHDSSRYPVDARGKAYERPERVDLNELHRTAKAVSSLLTAAYDQADDWLQNCP